MGPDRSPLLPVSEGRGGAGAARTPLAAVCSGLASLPSSPHSPRPEALPALASACFSCHRRRREIAEPWSALRNRLVIKDWQLLCGSETLSGATVAVVEKVFVLDIKHMFPKDEDIALVKLQAPLADPGETPPSPKRCHGGMAGAKVCFRA